MYDRSRKLLAEASSYVHSGGPIKLLIVGKQPYHDGAVGPAYACSLYDPTVYVLSRSLDPVCGSDVLSVEWWYRARSHGLCSINATSVRQDVPETCRRLMWESITSVISSLVDPNCLVVIVGSKEPWLNSSLVRSSTGSQCVTIRCNQPTAEVKSKVQWRAPISMVHSLKSICDEMEQQGSM